MRIRLNLVGQSPYVMHNVQLANPDNAWSKAIAKIHAKRKNMTEQDRQEIARLQWFGGLYVGHNGYSGPVVPVANIRRCLQSAATATKDGKTITRAVIQTDIEVPLVYDGPTNVQDLFQLPQFVYTTMVGINRGKVLATRPIFPHWEVTADFELVTELLDYDKFVDISRRAGIIEGLGDNRINGYGRFDANVAKL